MAEINLLPEDLRKKEAKEKERIARNPKSFDILLNQPRSSRAKEIEPATKESWWRKILGYPTVATEKASNDHPKGFDAVGDPVVSGIAKRREVAKHISLGRVEKEKHKKNWFSFLGSPQPLITSMPKNGSINRLEISESAGDHQRVSTSIAREKNATIINDRNYRPTALAGNAGKYNDSWWQVLKSLFVPVKHQSEKVSLVSDDFSGKPMIRNSSKTQDIASQNHENKVSSSNDFGTAIEIQSQEKKQPVKGHKKNKMSAYNLVESRGRNEAFNVNLVPTELLVRRKIDRKGEFLQLSLAIIVPIIILACLYGVIFWAQTQLGLSLRQRSALLDLKVKEIGDYESRLKKNNDLAFRMANIANLRKNKLDWSNFFDLLERYTLNGVYYNSLSMDTSGSLLLPGIADNYETAAKQLALLNNAGDFVKDARISNLQIFNDAKTGFSGISFQLRLVLSDHVFSLKMK